MILVHYFSHLLPFHCVFIPLCPFSVIVCLTEAMKLFGVIWCRSVGLSHYFMLLQSFYVFQFLVPISLLFMVNFHHVLVILCLLHLFYFLVCFLFFSPLVSVCVILHSFTVLLDHLSLISLSFYDGVRVAGCYYSITVRRFWI